MLDAMIASALQKLLDRHVHFRRRVSVEEQRAQKYDRFLRGRQIAYLIYERFRATGACEAVQGLSDLFRKRLQNDDVQEFDVRWDQAILSASETHTEMVLEGLYKSKDSVQLQTVLDLYDQEAVRNNEQPSYSRNQESTRKESLRFEESGRMLSVEKQMDSVRKETLVVSAMIRHLETDARLREQKDNRKQMRGSENKRTTVLSRTKFEGQD